MLDSCSGIGAVSDHVRSSCVSRRQDRAHTYNIRLWYVEMLVGGSRETLKWVAWFNHSRLLEPIGYVPPAEHEEAYYGRQQVPTELAALT